MDKQEQESLLEQFMRLEMLLHRQFMKHHRFRGPFGNPHRGQPRVLALLRMQPEITQKELSKLLDMRPQSLGEILSKLERAGYITREPSVDDKRVMVIKITEAGLHAGIDTEQKQETDNTIFDSLTDDEQKQLSQLMTKLIDEAEKDAPLDTRGEFPFGRRRGGHHFDRMRKPFPNEDEE